MKKLLMTIKLTVLLSCPIIASQNEDYLNVGPMTFVFSSEIDEKIKSIEKLTTWGCGSGPIYGIHLCMYHLLPREKFTQLSLDAILKMPYFPQQREKIKIPFLYILEETPSEFIEYLFSDEAKKKYNDEDIKKLQSIIKTSDFSDVYGYINIKTSPREIDFLPVSLFIMEQGIKCQQELRNKLEELNEREFVAFNDLSAFLSASAFRFYIRTQIEPDLFSYESKKILFYPLRHLSEIDLTKLAKIRGNLVLPTGKILYSVPAAWAPHIKTWEWDTFVKDFKRQMNEFYNSK